MIDASSRLWDPKCTLDGNVRHISTELLLQAKCLLQNTRKSRRRARNNKTSVRQVVNVRSFTLRSRDHFNRRILTGLSKKAILVSPTRQSAPLFEPSENTEQARSLDVHLEVLRFIHRKINSPKGPFAPSLSVSCLRFRVEGRGVTSYRERTRSKNTI